MRTFCAVTVMILFLGASAQAEFNARAALAKRLTAISFNQIGLSDAVDFFRDTTDGNFVVDWKSLEQVGIGKDTVVNLKLRNVRTDLALKKTLESAAPKLLTFYVDQNVITITTQAIADTHMVTRLYAVQDLLLDIPDFVGPTFDLTQTQGSTGSRTGGQGNANGGGNSNNTSLFGNSNATQTNEKTKTPAERGQDLIDLIETTIRPEIWNTHGGKASIKFFNGNLIITAPITVQEQIG